MMTSALFASLLLAASAHTASMAAGPSTLHCSGVVDQVSEGFVVVDAGDCGTLRLGIDGLMPAPTEGDAIRVSVTVDNRESTKLRAKVRALQAQAKALKAAGK